MRYAKVFGNGLHRSVDIARRLGPPRSGSDIAGDNPHAAAALVRRVIARVDAAASFPFAQRRVPEFDEERTREAILNPYRIVYAVDQVKQTITILRVWHAARGVPGLNKT
ncbi:MAG: type II toxin-antitoxin system RelE/ParE family toxin [Candidatus Hydrogenedentota bacterium]